MKVVIAIDSFKGSLSSLSAGNAVRDAIRSLDSDAEVFVSPLADGGEGTVEALYEGLGGEMFSPEVCGPLGQKVKAPYCILKSGTAVMEMSAAAGITLVADAERNPMKTTTFGVGEMIRDALDRGCRSFLVGIGGSATNDGGVGMLSALGFEFLDEKGNGVPLGGEGLEKIASIGIQKADPRLKECIFRIACDVTNPLCGERGCSAVFGPQKGATPEMIEKMDAWLLSYARLTKEVFPASDATLPGVGAAGGLGFAFSAFLSARLESGIGIVLDEICLEEKIQNSDLVITGEGRLDAQTAMGKAPIGVARLAKKYGKRVIAFSGCVTRDAILLNEHGIDAFFPIVPGAVSLTEAMNVENARENLIRTATQVFRLII